MHARPGTKLCLDPKENKDLYFKLSRYCFFLSQNKWDGEDLAQETIAKALNHYGHNMEFTSALLKKIARNLWLDQRQKQSREHIGYASEEKIPENVLADSGLLEKVVASLTSKQAVILSLKDGFHFKIAEVAEIMGMSETGVKAAINRARKRLTTTEVNEEASVIQIVESSDVISDVLIQSIRSNDPSQLIKQIPALFPESQEPTLKLMASSPSSSLLMAA
ncbi:sigma factor-like helix-turn-helix DNA-binding protein [Halobacillus massiliensis]|uniref:sigma factor-like helix-turn-helix DNA-binding protein n=1 Tax=Halobacillus massiliensis TaxID=1926286 RepID=UPI0009E5DCBD|nr:sigma factor-like helix-turn-helix DNA-binding protein [Halobacillus massiliensis]